MSNLTSHPLADLTDLVGSAGPSAAGVVVTSTPQGDSGPTPQTPIAFPRCGWRGNPPSYQCRRDPGHPMPHILVHHQSTAVQQVDATSVEITGDLTIKGVTSSIPVPFEFGGASTDPFGNQRIGFEGQVTINCKDHGLIWNAALETGDVLVSDKIVLEFEVSAITNA